MSPLFRRLGLNVLAGRSARGTVSSEPPYIRIRHGAAIIKSTLSRKSILTAGFVLCISTFPVFAGPISFAYNFGKPNLGPDQSIKQLDVAVTTMSSALGKNGNLANPALAMQLVPNPFIAPKPNCMNTPQFCSLEPISINGVDPKGKNPTDDQFFFDRSKFAVAPGNPTNTNLMKPGIGGGTTVRTDAVSTTWEPFTNEPQFNAQNRLRFGATLNVQEAIYQPPNTGIGVAPAPRNVYPSTVSLTGATWLLSDDTKVNTAALAAHTIQMGQDVFDLNENFLAGLIFRYTNDAPNEVTLNNLVFFTTSDSDALADPEPQGTFLTSALVMLNGLLLPTQSFYHIPSGATLRFTFLHTVDPYFVAEADVFADGLFQVGYGYEAQLQVPEPPSWMLLALTLALAFATWRFVDSA
jgi:hypothetical protein